MAYDSRCYDLAALFLSDNPEKDTEANRKYLAQHIQEEIEGTIQYILKPAPDAVGNSLDPSSALSEKSNG